ncbi:hypothetical protein PF005_g21368 [Phytophthora fragariae]|uniref:Uncharacterized protein n=1 Tax=Phytophthora fragariae TaxID=53985 RepID=A0A6A3S7S2_9STRA|nr:hypothetical protein PF003_g10529 [Phytophthora fragariae]KAE8927528.1 hypothetical protein PF009_g22308 [Phytophthora fragariae]KAE8985846.1 hypothetical protein PF011_g20228 [Phytophthora fragariae]KAE9084675.1 hypothetical protein PF007_g21431 [Phytophthora fragariae]KAE9111078.1 hypothetical protein PF006_g20304 [Phytophthora fragariae]
MMPSMSSEQYEVMYMLRSELFAKQGTSSPDRFTGPRGFGRGWNPWMTDITPAERDVLMKYHWKGKQRAAVGGLVGASAMAGVWKMTKLGGVMGVAGMIVGGVIGARVSMRTSGIREKVISEMLKLPEDKSPNAAQAREILATKLQHNRYAQELLQQAGFAK